MFRVSSLGFRVTRGESEQSTKTGSIPILAYLGAEEAEVAVVASGTANSGTVSARGPPEAEVAGGAARAGGGPGGGARPGGTGRQLAAKPWLTFLGCSVRALASRQAATHPSPRIG